MQSTPTLKQTDPHDVFAIETILAAHADRAPPLAHDPASAAPPIHVAPEISPDAFGAPAPQLDTTFRATDVSDVRGESAGSDTIRVDGPKPPAARPASKWQKRITMALLGLCGATAAAAWQHYGDQAKATAAAWTPPFVLAALSPSEKPAAAEQANAPAIQAAASPAQPEHAVATTSPAESTQLQSMAQDLAAMSQQVEELKAGIAQLKASQAEMARYVAKSSDAKSSDAKSSDAKASESKTPESKTPEIKASEARAPEQASRPKVSALSPQPRPAAAPPRKPKPASTPAQAAYVAPLPPAPAPVQLQSAPPPQAMADDGAPVVRPPMPLR